MKKFLIKYGWIILLAGVIVSACGTTPTPVGPIEVQMTSMAAQVQACATLQSLGTPYPCNPPTATSTPIPPTSTPTPPPFTGWMYYREGGGATQMPYGFEPLACDNKLVGCPGQSYRYFVNGVPQGPDANTYKGTPSYWPYILVGVPVGVAVLVLLFFSAYGMAAPQRAIAKATLLMAQAYASTLGQVQGNPALPSSVDNAALPVEFLARLLGDFMKGYEVPHDFKRVIGSQLRQYRKGDLVPLVTFQQMLRSFDKEHSANVAQPFGDYLAAHAHELVGGSNG